MSSVSNPSEALLEFAANAQAPLVSFEEANVSPVALQAQGGAEGSGWDSAWGGLDLRNRTLAGARLRAANLAQVNFGGADLADIAGPGANLHGARLEGAQLSRADLAGANLTAVAAGEANFGEALLEDAKLSGGQFRFADFREAILDGADFSEADLWGAKFTKTAAERVRFHKARLDESSLAEAELGGADFTQATMRRADLAMAKLQNADLRDAVLDGANLAGANLAGAILPNLSLSSCVLTHACFAGSWLERTRMSAHQLGGMVGEEALGDLERAVDSYIVLERNFRSLGTSEDASWAYLRRRRVGCRLLGREARKAYAARKWRVATIAGLRWFGELSAEWLCDYGESLFRVARSFLVILLVFALVYWITGSLKAREGFADTRLWAPINYLLFSLDSMTTVGTSEVALRPRGELGILLSSVQTVLGTILLGLFGFVLGARIRR